MPNSFKYMEMNKFITYFPQKLILLIYYFLLKLHQIN